MRPRGRTRPAALVTILLVAAVVLAGALAEKASAQSTGRGWRAARYGRRGAEMWVEFPRFGFATGAGYKDDYDIGTGFGFGFGGMFGFSDNLAIEGMMLQSNHSVGPEEKQWDLDTYQVGLRYTFLVNRAFQPFVAAGGARIALERDASADDTDEFQRLTGFGAYASVGLDYTSGPSWTFFLRGDYTLGGYGRAIIGNDDDKLDDAVRGDSFALSLGVAYRIPAW